MKKETVTPLYKNGKTYDVCSLAGFGRTQTEYSLWYWSTHLKEDVDYFEFQGEFSKDHQKKIEEMSSFSI